MRRSVKLLPTSRAVAGTPVSDETPQAARPATGQHPPRQTGDSSTVAPVVRRGGLVGWLWARVARAPYLSREEQFRLLQVALRIKLRHEGKPEDLITLRRPDDLPAPPGTPVRQPKRDLLYARNDDDHQAQQDAPHAETDNRDQVR